MSVKTVSISKLGRNYRISPSFKLSEMACRDGSDKVKYSTELMAKLEELRAYVGGTIGINSGYRTPSYNRSIRGASNSNHTKGLAADIVVKKNGKRISGKLICCLCQTLGFKGVAYIKGSGYAVHVDMSNRIYRGDERRGYSNNVGGDFYKYFKISKSQIAALKAAPTAPVNSNEQGEEEVTQEQFNKMMDVWIAAKKAETCEHEWSKEARDWAENDTNGQALIKGDGTSKAYHMYPTREELIAIVHRLVKKLV